MTSTGQIDTGRAQLAPAVEEGISLLWTFQLRKEHAALLERLEANERVIQARVDATSRYFQEMNERVEVLETRLAKIESEEEADRKAIEDWGAAVRTLKKKIESGGTPHRAVELPVHPPNSHTVTTAHNVQQSHDNDSGQPSNYRRDTNNNFSTLQTVSEGSVPKSTNRRVAARAPSRKSKPGHLEPPKPRATRNRPAGIAQPTRARRLIQGTSKLATYFKNATVAFSNVSTGDMKEVDFVSAFLDGLRESEQRDTLVKELEKAHLCSKGKDGRVVIHCEWKYVGKGLRKTGLLSSDPASGKPSGN